MKLLFSLIILLFFSTLVCAQQLPLFSQYREYMGLINPAAISTDYFVYGTPDRMIKVGGGQRQQWLGNENFDISTSALQGEAFFNPGTVSFLGGAYFLHDGVDVTKMDGFFGRLAVYVGDPRYGNFWGGVGFYAGYVIHTVDIRKLRSYYADSALDLAELTTGTTDIGFGGFGVYQWDDNDKRLLFGLSVPQLLERNLSFMNESSFDYQRIRHFYGNISFIASSSQRNYGFFEASLWGKYVEGLRPNIDLNLRYQVSSPFWFGLGASSSGTAHVEVGTNLVVGRGSSYDSSENFLKIGFAVDYPFDTNYGTVFGHSMEINVAYVSF